MTAQVAYDEWKRDHKMDLSVKTDYQMFELGYNMREDQIKELTNLILDMEKEHKRLNTEVLSLKRKLKTAKGKEDVKG